MRDLLWSLAFLGLGFVLCFAIFNGLNKGELSGRSGHRVLRKENPTSFYLRLSIYVVFAVSSLCFATILFVARMKDVGIFSAPS